MTESSNFEILSRKKTKQNNFGTSDFDSTTENRLKNTIQGSKIVLVRSYLRVPQAAGQVKMLIFLVKFNFFPIYANIFCDAGQVPILRYFEVCH